MVYKVSVEIEHEEFDHIFSSLEFSKRHYTEVLAFYMREGCRFSIELFSGDVDRDGIFWPHECIATFDYDGDASVCEASK